jgi:hypothetical protein
VAGRFADGTLHITPEEFSSSSAQLPRAYVARLGTATGSTVWARAYGMPDASGAAFANALIATDNRRLVVGGQMFGTVDFGDRPLTANVSDGFVLRLYP